MATPPKTLSQRIQSDRVIRVFLATAGTELDKERASIFQYGVPQLNVFAKENDVEIVFIDLSWGASANSLQEQIQLKLEAMEKCTYFIGIMGNRYGEVPNIENPLEWNEAIEKLFPALKECKGKSVLEMEIYLSSLCEKPTAFRSFFYNQSISYFSEGISSEEEKSKYLFDYQKEEPKLNALIDAVKQKHPVHGFESPEHLTETIIENIKSSISHDFSFLTKEQCGHSEERAHEQFMSHRLTSFEGREELLNSLAENVKYQLENDSTPLSCISAESGIGKSSLMAALVRKLSTGNPEYHTLYHFVGCTNMSNYVYSINERMNNKVRAALKLTPDSVEKESKNIDVLLELIKEENKGEEKIIIIIDAINQIQSTHGAPQPHTLYWLPKETPKNVAIVLSTIDTHPTNEVAQKNGFSIFPVSRLSAEEASKAIVSYLHRYEQQLSSELLDYIIKEGKEIGHPLYLRVLMEQLRMGVGSERLVLEIQRLLSNPTVQELYEYVISVWELRYGPETVEYTLSSLAISRIGFSEKDMDNFIQSQLPNQFRMNLWKSFLYTLMDSLFIRNGKYSFFHQLFLEAVTSKYLKSKKELDAAHSRYGHWLLTQFNPEAEDTESLSAEVVYNLMKAEDYEAAVRVLSYPKVVIAYLQGKYRYEFFQIWRDLKKFGHSDISTYTTLIHDKGPIGTKLIDYFRETQNHSFLIPVIQKRIEEQPDEDERHFDHFTLGWILFDSGKYDRALAQHKIALEIRKRIYGEKDHADLGDSYNHIGLCYWVTREFSKALESYEISMKIRKSVYGMDHTDVAQSNNNFGAVYHSMGEYEKALEYYHISCDLYRRVCGESHPDVATAYNNLGVIYDAIDDKEKALQYYGNSLKILTDILGESHLNIAQLNSNVAVLYESLRRYSEAVECYQKARAIRVSILGEQHQKTRESIRAISRVQGILNIIAQHQQQNQQQQQQQQQDEVGETDLDEVEVEDGGEYEADI